MLWVLRALRYSPGVFLDAVYGWGSCGTIVGWPCMLQPVVSALLDSVLYWPVGVRVGSCCVQGIIVSLVCKGASLAGCPLEISNTYYEIGILKD